MNHEHIKTAFLIGAILFIGNAIFTAQGWELLFGACYVIHKCLTAPRTIWFDVSPSECDHDISPEDCPDCMHKTEKDHD